jgi:hypothetical protein
VAKIYQVILDESIRTQQQHGFGGPPQRPPKRSSRK